MKLSLRSLALAAALPVLAIAAACADDGGTPVSVGQRAPIDTFAISGQRAQIDTFALGARAPIDTFAVAAAAPIDTMY